jgi:glycosyltransferase involved in cell wall biosynthesis
LAGRVSHPPVTFVASHAQLGGQEAYLLSLLQSLDPAAVRGVVSLQDGPAVARLKGAGRPVWVIPTGARLGLLRGVVRLRRLLKATGAELVHADGTKAALCSVLAAARTGVPVVWMKHDGAFDGRLARAVASRCAAVVGVSRTVVETLDGVHGPSVHVVRNGIPAHQADRAEAARELRAALDAPEDAEVVIQVARIVANKGQRDTVEAAAGVLAERPRARFAFVGDIDSHGAAYAQEVRARARELGIDGAVTFLGHRDDAVRLIAGADVLVVPSLCLPGFHGWREGGSLVAAEAMMVGTPVLAYADPAVIETLEGCGTVVAPGDIPTLARALTALLADPDRRRALAACGRLRARDLRLERALAELTEVYRGASRSRNGAGSARA